MANARGQQIDKTFLSLDQAEERGFIHRDYIAHCLRWSHVIKFLGQRHRYQTARILDIGCGKEVPLAKTLYTSKMSPVNGYYIGVDYGDIPHQGVHDKMAEKFVFGLHRNVNSANDISIDKAAGVVSIKEKHRLDRPNVITCFEVLEHMEPELVIKTLKNIKDIITDDGNIFISTPCFNGSAAANHVNEMTYQGLYWLLYEVLGFEVVANYGTFASQKDYLSQLQEDGYDELFGLLSNYYDSNLLSIIFAPLYPDKSRNVLWHLRKGRSLGDLKEHICDVETMVSSSDKSWADALAST